MSKSQFIEVTCKVHGKSLLRIKEITSVVPLSGEEYGTRITLYNGSVYRVNEDYDKIKPIVSGEVPQAA